MLLGKLSNVAKCVVDRHPGSRVASSVPELQSSEGRRTRNLHHHFEPPTTTALPLPCIILVGLGFVLFGLCWLEAHHKTYTIW